MLRSDAFSYINVLDKAADASWLRQTTIANNIANNDTPTYKRKDVRF
ncbi:MAG: flagellar basal body rod protein FlgB, partial [Lachnospiraceae bacterium]|nr:flagellar basal body rod protein FlgB [Lachnospiraceae bacterium]